MRTLEDLRGRTLSVPEMNREMVVELLVHAGIGPQEVSLVPYAHDPVPLITGQVDGLVDFIVDPRFRLAQANVDSHAILVFDHGAPLPNNLVVVTGSTFETHRDELAHWIAASRRGWQLNYQDPAVYPRRLRGNPLVESRTLEHEIYANQAFRPLVDTKGGPMSLSPSLVERTRGYLDRIGLSLPEEIFVELG